MIEVLAIAAAVAAIALLVFALRGDRPEEIGTHSDPVPWDKAPNTAATSGVAAPRTVSAASAPDVDLRTPPAAMRPAALDSTSGPLGAHIGAPRVAPVRIPAHRPAPAQGFSPRAISSGTVDDFTDLLNANRNFAASFTLGGFDGVAKAGVAIVTCMDSRIDPLAMLGLKAGDAKIFRNPGGRVTPQALVALVLGAHLLNVKRILVVPHTRCAMASSSEQVLHDKISASAGQDASWLGLGAIKDQSKALIEDVHKVRSHPLIPDSVQVGGFIYDVDTGRLTQQV